MTILTAQAFLSLAMACAPPMKGLPDALLKGISITESGLNTATISPKNHDGSYDVGLMQVNSSHFGEPIGFHGTIITHQTALDPCNSIAAGAHILLCALSRYNTGDCQRGIANGYAGKVIAAMARDATSHAPSPVPPEDVAIEDGPALGEIIFTGRAP